MQACVQPASDANRPTPRASYHFFARAKHNIAAMSATITIAINRAVITAQRVVSWADITAQARPFFLNLPQ